MMRILGACALLAASAMSAVASTGHVGVIYGNDDRQDVYQVQSKMLRDLADSTVALFRSGDVTAAGQSFQLSTENYGQSMHLCAEEPFFDQGTGAFCSGSLVAPDVIMTAGHCVTSADACAQIKFVFGFSIKEKGSATPAAVPSSDVYGCKELIGREQVNDGADWSLVRLDRPVIGHKPLKLNMTGSIAKGAPVVVIGHPSGLPTKVAGGANVRDASNPGFFVANLDTYGGNSGSAVFNAETGLVEGILVRGETDFVAAEGRDCQISNVCPADGCRGEDVTKIANVADKIPAAENEERVAKVQASLATQIAALSCAEPRP